jgi:hypothetical protein
MVRITPLVSPPKVGLHLMAAEPASKAPMPGTISVSTSLGSIPR